MKRNRRPNPHFISPFLALFIVTFLAVAAFPTELPAAVISITIKNHTGRQLYFQTINGNDKDCANYYQAVQLPTDLTATLKCDDGGTGQCKVAGRDTSYDAADARVIIDSKYTTTGFGCAGKQVVQKDRILNCAWDGSNPNCQ